ncbi:TlpA family protein disulfide reductase [Polaribacter gangjinensis]|nr:TlpA disulfide reductase family protein [Polaribacter gangjinensis]
MLKKVFINGGLVILLYITFVFLFKTQTIIFPLFMIGAFVASMYMSYKNVLASFAPLLAIWFIQLFLPDIKLSSVIIYIVFTPLSFLLGYYLKNKSIFLKLGYPIIIVFVGIYGFVNFLYVVENHDSFKRIQSPKMEFSHNENQIRVDTIQNKVIVLDFWTTSCGACFQQFPEFENIFKKYKNSTSVSLFAVNIPERRDTIGYAKTRIERYNYQFPVLFSDSDTIPKQLGFNKYPTQIILKNGIIRFIGNLNMNEKNVFIYKLEYEIEKLLNE